MEVFKKPIASRPFPMPQPTTVLNQLLQLLPRDAFQTVVGQHKADRYVKRLTTWNQLTILLYAQLTGKDSLREIETGLRVQESQWTRLGLKTAARSTLARANATRPAAIFETLFVCLRDQCQKLLPGTAARHTSAYEVPDGIHALDSSSIELCLTLFPWARFRTAKGAMKLHTLFDVTCQVPESIVMTDGKTSDIRMAKEMDWMTLPRGSIITMDRGYNDYPLFAALDAAGHIFVVRLKKDAHVFSLRRERSVLEPGVLKDEDIAFALPKAQESYPKDLRLVTFHDEEHDVTYRFLTNNWTLSAGTIAAIYKKRWDVELFFKWLKQHLQVKTFLGTSKNAVLSQVWVAMICYLLISWMRFQTKYRRSLLELTRMLREVLLERVSIINLLSLCKKTVQRAIIRAGPRQLILV